MRSLTVGHNIDLEDFNPGCGPNVTLADRWVEWCMSRLPGTTYFSSCLIQLTGPAGECHEATADELNADVDDSMTSQGSNSTAPAMAQSDLASAMDPGRVDFDTPTTASLPVIVHSAQTVLIGGNSQPDAQPPSAADSVGEAIESADIDSDDDVPELLDMDLDSDEDAPELLNMDPDSDDDTPELVDMELEYEDEGEELVHVSIDSGIDVTMAVASLHLGTTDGIDEEADTVIVEKVKQKRGGNANRRDKSVGVATKQKRGGNAGRRNAGDEIATDAKLRKG
jgi:hypothetical protein